MRSANNAKFAFYYLLSLISLAFLAISVGLIAFGIIDKTVSDPLLFDSYVNYQSRFKFAISALIIAAPIFYLSLSLIKKGLVKKEIEVDSDVRKWLTYLILLVSSVVILGSLVSVVNGFLSGDLTLRFILKTVVVFLISILIFAYYFYDIKREEIIKKDRLERIFLILSLILISLAFISVWFFVESPKEARNRRFDEVILRNINNLDGAVNNYYRENKKLPGSLEEVNLGNYYLNTNTLEDLNLEYKKTGDYTYVFCATFKSDNTDSLRSGIYDRSIHSKGYNCLDGHLWERMEEVEKLK